MLKQWKRNFISHFVIFCSVSFWKYLFFLILLYQKLAKLYTYMRNNILQISNIIFFANIYEKFTPKLTIF